MRKKLLFFPDSKEPFISLMSSDWVDSGTLIWSEMPSLQNDCESVVKGPFELLTPWCNSLLGSKNANRNNKKTVEYIDLSDGKLHKITHNTLLFSCFYVLKEDFKY